ncbi:MAG: HD domain-containing phosphohydrolase, partial [Vulcanimicrobiota bacterium]
YLDRNNCEKAARHFLLTLETLGDHGLAYYQLGQCYLAMKQNRKAMESFLNALAQTPDDLNVLNALGFVHMKMGEYDKAIDYYNNVIKLAPDNPSVYRNLGTMHFMQNNYSDARDSLIQACRLDKSGKFDSFVNTGIEAVNYKFKSAHEQLMKATDKVISSENYSPAYTALQLLATSTLEQAESSFEFGKEFKKHNSLSKGLARILGKLADELGQKNYPHSENVAWYAYTIARFAGFTRNRLEEIFLAGLLHDIGKLKLSPYIFSRPPWELNPEDLKQFESHPLKAYELLEEIKGMKEISLMILNHHERFDGKGYPNGTEGRQISLETGILSIADKWDNLINLQKLDSSEAIDIITGLRFKKFSSEAVNAFMSSIDELLFSNPATERNSR